MSLADKFEKYTYDAGKNGQRFFGFEDLQRAFYAGAEAALKETGDGTYFEIQAEIDHFRSHK